MRRYFRSFIRVGPCNTHPRTLGPYCPARTVPCLDSPGATAQNPQTRSLDPLTPRIPVTRRPDRTGTFHECQHDHVLHMITTPPVLDPIAGDRQISKWTNTDSRDRVPVPSGCLRSGNLCTPLTRTFGICSVYRKIHHIGLSACDMSRARAAAIYRIWVSRLAGCLPYLHFRTGNMAPLLVRHIPSIVFDLITPPRPRSSLCAIHTVFCPRREQTHRLKLVVYIRLPWGYLMILKALGPSSDHAIRGSLPVPGLGLSAACTYGLCAVDGLYFHTWAVLASERRPFKRSGRQDEWTWW